MARENATDGLRILPDTMNRVAAGDEQRARQQSQSGDRSHEIPFAVAGSIARPPREGNRRRS